MDSRSRRLGACWMLDIGNWTCLNEAQTNQETPGTIDFKLWRPQICFLIPLTDVRDY